MSSIQCIYVIRAATGVRQSRRSMEIQLVQLNRSRKPGSLEPGFSRKWSNSCLCKGCRICKIKLVLIILDVQAKTEYNAYKIKRVL